MHQSPSKDLIEAAANMGLEAASSSAQGLGARLRQDYDRWAPIVKRIGFTADQSFEYCPLTGNHSSGLQRSSIPIIRTLPRS